MSVWSVCECDNVSVQHVSECEHWYESMCESVLYSVSVGMRAGV